MENSNVDLNRLLWFVFATVVITLLFVAVVIIFVVSIITGRNGNTYGGWLNTAINTVVTLIGTGITMLLGWRIW